MRIQVKSKVTKNIRKKSILQQTAFWSEVKRKQGIDSKAFDIQVKASDLMVTTTRQDTVADDLLMLFQNIGDGYCIGYAPYGPTIKPSENAPYIGFILLNHKMSCIMKPIYGAFSPSNIAPLAFISDLCLHLNLA